MFGLYRTNRAAIVLRLGGGGAESPPRLLSTPRPTWHLVCNATTTATHSFSGPRLLPDGVTKPPAFSTYRGVRAAKAEEGRNLRGGPAPAPAAALYKQRCLKAAEQTLFSLVA